jgi:hypothetical protein
VPVLIWKIRAGDIAGASSTHRLCDDGMEFAHVAIPLVGCKRLQRRGGEPDGVMHAQIPQDGPDEFGDDVGLLPQRGQLNLLGTSRNQLAGLQYQLVGGHDRRQDHSPSEAVENSGQ